MTTEQIINKYHWDNVTGRNSIKEMLLEFAEYHTKKALKEATRVLDVDEDGDYINYPTRTAILKAYDLKNIQ